VRNDGRRRPGLTALVAGALLLAAAGVGAAAREGSQPVPDAGEVPSAVLTPGRSTSAAPTASPSGPAAAPAASPETGVAAVPDGVPAPSGTPAEAASPGATLTPAPDRSFLPTTLLVPAIGVAAPVVPTTADDKGALVVPENPRDVGWWSGGAAPGAPYGTVLMAGHVDSAEKGLGSLVDLSRTPVGAVVTVTGQRGTSAAYRVVARRSYPKATLPWRDLFRQDVRARLLVVTCGGEFDRRTGHYERNVVVFAVPA